MNRASETPSTTPQRMTWPIGHVALVLGMSTETFARKRARLEAEHGFPTKLPGLNSWSAPAIIHWLRTNGGTYGAGAPTISDDDPYILSIAAELEADYAGARQHEAA